MFRSLSTTLLLFFLLTTFGFGQTKIVGDGASSVGNQQYCDPLAAANNNDVLGINGTCADWIEPVAGSAVSVDIGGNGDDTNLLDTIFILNDSNGISSVVTDNLTLDFSKDYPKSDQTDALSATASINANTNVVKILSHATDCLAIVTAVDGQYCWEKDADVLYVCETADVCDTAGEWDAVASVDITCTGCVEDAALASTFLKAADINPLADLNTVAGTTLQNFNTLTDENLCSYESTGTQIDCDTPTSTFEPAGTYSGIGTCTAQFVRVLNDGAAPTCESVADADVPDTITASNYCPLGGCTYTGTVTLKDQTITIADSGDGNPASDSGTTIAGNDVYIVCNDVHGCNYTASETGAMANKTVRVWNYSSSNVVNIVDSSGVVSTCTNANVPLAAGESTFITYFAEPANEWKQDCTIVDYAQLNNVPVWTMPSGSGPTTDETGEVAINTTRKCIQFWNGSASVMVCPNKTLTTFRPQQAEPPASNFATIDTRNSHPVLDFDASTNECTNFTFIMPQLYSGNGVTMYIHYAMTSATSGDVDWNIAFERIGDQQLDIDADSFAAAQSVIDTAVPATSGNVDVVSIAFTNGAQMDSCAVGEACRIQLCRGATADTATGDAEIVALEMRET